MSEKEVARIGKVSATPRDLRFTARLRIEKNCFAENWRLPRMAVASAAMAAVLWIAEGPLFAALERLEPNRNEPVLPAGRACMRAETTRRQLRLARSP